MMETYKNPILYGDYSDPDVIRVGADYYMVASSFTYLPGVPLLHSRDLVHWEIINYCVPSLPFEKYDLPSHGSGTWAPAIRYVHGTFFVFVPLPDEGIFVARSQDPYGTFQLNCLCQAKGWIDPCPFWDEDGRAYMIFAYARSRCGIKHRLALVEMDPDCMGLLGEPKLLFDGIQMGPTTEGPKMYKKDGWYYVLMPSGGVATGWQSALRAKDIYGPYEYRIVMHQGDTPVNGPHQGGWVDTPQGEDWFIHFQDVGEFGRVTHLQPMCWNGGWPFIGMETNGDGIGEPVSQWTMPVQGQPEYRIPDSDDFSGERLGLQWQWQANPKEAYYSLKEHPGKLTLPCWSNPHRENLLWYAPNVLTQIPQSPAFDAQVRLELVNGEKGDRAVLGMTGHSYAFAGLEKGENGMFISLYRGTVTGKEFLGEAREEQVWGREWHEGPVWIEMRVRADKTFTFAWSGDGQNFQEIPCTFRLSKGTWTGAKICLWAGGGDNQNSKGRGVYDYIHIQHKSRG